jgi:uncharacterized glyoxalase superfamily protein PhnB
MTQRFQLALNVDNLEVAIEYYRKLFGVEVNKRKPGYANFAIDKPALKLVLFENPGAAERINHLGVENTEQQDVDAAVVRLKEAGIATTDEIEESCCYAKQNKVWSTDPAGTRWEWYRILEDTAEFGVESRVVSQKGRCC